MTEKTKGDRFLLVVPKGQEERFRLYKKIAKELGKSVNERIWQLIEEDEEKLFSILKTLEKEVKVNDESE